MEVPAAVEAAVGEEMGSFGMSPEISQNGTLPFGGHPSTARIALWVDSRMSCDLAASDRLANIAGPSEGSRGGSIYGRKSEVAAEVRTTVVLIQRTSGGPKAWSTRLSGTGHRNLTWAEPALSADAGSPRPLRFKPRLLQS